MEHRGTGFGGLFSVPSGALEPACGGRMERLEQVGTVFRGLFTVPSGGGGGARGRGTIGDACRTLLGRLRLIVLSWMAVGGKGAWKRLG